MSTRPTNKQINSWVMVKFTKKQLEAYSLIHPDLGGLTARKAADELGITTRAVEYRLNGMRKRYPQAFRFEDTVTEEQTQIANSHKKEKEMSKLHNIMTRTKQLAKRYKVPFRLTKDEFLEIIRQTCFVCGNDGNRDGITEDGRHFKYNGIILRIFTAGFNYVNSHTVCGSCMSNQSWRNLQRFKRMGF